MTPKPRTRESQEEEIQEEASLSGLIYQRELGIIKRNLKILGDK